MDQSEKKLRGIQFRKFNKLLGCQIQRCIYRFYICVWHYGRAHRKFFLRPGGALHMYEALRLFNLHLQSALLQFNFHFVFSSCE
jgi:hypothetical protein